MSGDDETIPIGEAVRSLESMGRKLAEMRRQRDQYRDWFERLFAAAWSGDGALQDVLQKVQSERDHVVNARTRANRAKGEKTRALVLRMRDEEGKSIAETARETGLSLSYVARIRGKSKDTTTS